MDYHKTNHAFRRSVAFLRASLAVQGAHAWLLTICGEQENGGAIADCKDYGDRDWSALSNGQVRARDVQAVVAAGLATWQGQALQVEGYDVGAERDCVRGRQRARTWREKRLTAPNGDCNADPNGSRTGTRTGTEPVRARVGVGRGGEGKGGGGGSGAVDRDDLTTPPAEPSGPPTIDAVHHRIAWRVVKDPDELRGHREAWEAFLRAYGWDAARAVNARFEKTFAQVMPWELTEIRAEIDTARRRAGANAAAAEIDHGDGVHAPAELLGDA